MNIGDRIRINHRYPELEGFEGVIVEPRSGLYSDAQLDDGRHVFLLESEMTFLPDATPLPVTSTNNREEVNHMFENATLTTSDGRSFNLVEATENGSNLEGFTILHPYGLYRTDGTRVDGYADRSRAIRRGREIFPRNGFVIVDATTATAESFSGSRS